MKSIKYTKEHIQFIRECKKDNSWKNVAILFERKFKIKRSHNALRKAMDLYADVDLDNELGQFKKDLIGLFREVVKELATLLECYPNTVSKKDYKKHPNALKEKDLKELGGFKQAIIDYIPDTKQQTIEKQDEENKRIKSNILGTFIELSDCAGFTASKEDMESEGITIQMINKHFGNFSGLYHDAVEQNPEVFGKFINEKNYSQEDRDRLLQAIQDHSRFVVTTAVSGKLVDEEFIRSIETYLVENNAHLLILPCEDVASRKSECRWELDPRLNQDRMHVIFDDTYLNDSIFLSSIMVSAKQIHPLTGLDRLAQKKGSMILASPKADLKFVANSNMKLPRALMTTGAITVPDYETDKYMSKRTSYLAEFDHKMAAVVVEIVDNDHFHFRELEAGDDGEIIDLAWQYNPDGSIEEVSESVGVFGDTHVGVLDLDVNDALHELTEYCNTKEIILHDLFDCRFNNHHDMHKVITRARLAGKGKISLMEEGTSVKEFIEEWTSKVDITIVKANHDEALNRYLDEGRWVKDPMNFYASCDLAMRVYEGRDPLKYLIEDKCGLNAVNRVNWLERDQDYKIYDAELSAHGDLGSNGSRGSLKSIERAYFKAIVGHSHSAGKLRNVKQVGTSSLMKLGYNRGPSSWTQTACFEYPNGTSQLINFIRIDGEIQYKLED